MPLDGAGKAEQVTAVRVKSEHFYKTQLHHRYCNTVSYKDKITVENHCFFLKILKLPSGMDTSNA